MARPDSNFFDPEFFPGRLNWHLHQDCARAQLGVETASEGTAAESIATAAETTTAATTTATVATETATVAGAEVAGETLLGTAIESGLAAGGTVGAAGGFEIPVWGWIATGAAVAGGVGYGIYKHYQHEHEADDAAHRQGFKNAAEALDAAKAGFKNSGELHLSMRRSKRPEWAMISRIMPASMGMTASKIS
jgi:hypothetical protein